jgi:hypothetical protein
MGVRQCDKCSEMVDDAKAFCPGCGAAFVEEEQRQEVSSFDQLERTVNLGNTMYNQMLSDMGLNISKTPEKSEKRIETITAIQAAPGAAESSKASATTPKTSKTIWIVLGIVATLILLPVAAASAIFLVRDILSRF